MQRFSCVDRTARQKLELRIFLLYLLGVCSRRHPVVTSGYILRLPGNITSSANANAVVHYVYVLFKSAFHSEGARSNHSKALLLNFVHFFFPVGLFPFILTDDPLKSLC